MLSIEKVNFDVTQPGRPEIFGASVDLSVLAGFEEIQLDGEPDLIVELIDLYLEDAPRRLAVMRESLAGSNWLSVKLEAHSLRGSSGNLGALQMALICEELEGTEAKCMPESVQAFISRLELELGRLLHIFLAERQKRSQ